MTISFKIAGTSYRPIEAQVRAAKLADGEILALVNEPTNEFDPNAIRVETLDYIHLGYVPRTMTGKVHEARAFDDSLVPFFDRATSSVILDAP